MSVSVNSVTIGGYLGKDPVLRATGDGTQVCSFSVGVSESWKDKAGEQKEKTEWVNVVVWGKLAEISGKYLQKGSPVLVEGKIQTRSYDHEGQKKYSTEIIASKVHFLSAKGGGNKRSDAHGDAPAFAGGDDLPF